MHIISFLIQDNNYRGQSTHSSKSIYFNSWVFSGRYNHVDSPPNYTTCALLDMSTLFSSFYLYTCLLGVHFRQEWDAVCHNPLQFQSLFEWHFRKDPLEEGSLPDSSDLWQQYTPITNLKISTHVHHTASPIKHAGTSETIPFAYIRTDTTVPPFLYEVASRFVCDTHTTLICKEYVTQLIRWPFCFLQ